MLIYHGSTAVAIDAILKDGIVPRALNGRSNWENCPSHEQMVYLTSTYPLYFAACAADSEKDKLVVVEIDFEKLKKGKLYPDEDFIAQVLYGQDRDKFNGRSCKATLEDFTKWVRNDIDSWRTRWRLSLEEMGTCAYHGTIPTDAILRYAVVDPAARPMLFFEMIQPTIMPMNYKIKGWFYQMFVRWVFGNEKELPQAAEARTLLSHEGNLGEIARKQLKHWLAESSNRTGVEVHDLAIG